MASRKKPDRSQVIASDKDIHDPLSLYTRLRGLELKNEHVHDSRQRHPNAYQVSSGVLKDRERNSEDCGCDPSGCG